VFAFANAVLSHLGGLSHKPRGTIVKKELHIERSSHNAKAQLRNDMGRLILLGVHLGVHVKAWPTGCALSGGIKVLFYQLKEEVGSEVLKEHVGVGTNAPSHPFGEIVPDTRSPVITAAHNVMGHFSVSDVCYIG
jgi:hypothetical protein